jgi:hypothetical protein
MNHIENTAFGCFSIVVCVFVAAEMCLPCHCLKVDVSSGSAILAFRHHANMYYEGLQKKANYFIYIFRYSVQIDHSWLRYQGVNLAGPLNGN